MAASSHKFADDPSTIKAAAEIVPGTKNGWNIVYIDRLHRLAATRRHG
jgi:hypothetical protein